MRSAVLGCLICLPLLAAVPGCRTVELVELFQQEQQYANDRDLQAKIEGRFAADPLLQHADLAVEVYQSNVTLTGRASPAQQRRALLIAGAFDQVDDVASDIASNSIAGSEEQ